MLNEIQRLVEAADFDGAYDKLKTLTREEIEGAIKQESSKIRRIRFACMASDVYDYAGRIFESTTSRLPNAASCIRIVEDEANREVEVFLGHAKKKAYRSPVDYSKFIKQCCWTLIHTATVHYRKDEYPEALTLLEGTVKQALDALERQRIEATKGGDEDREAYRGFGVQGTQSRLWYGIGLIRRQKREEREARKAFNLAIKYAGPGVALRRQEGKSAAFYDYSIGKAIGLGLGWLSYAEARLLESLAELVAARRVLPGKGVRYISSYLNVIYSRALLSASVDDGEQVDEAVSTLELACQELEDHPLYLHRAKYALALALIKRYSVFSSEKREVAKDLFRADTIIQRAKQSEWLRKEDRATLCNFLILESRIRRLQKDYDGAMEAANAASKVGRFADFVKVDCAICVGEAYFFRGDYQAATIQFESAYQMAENRSRKLLAACQLHLARTYLLTGNRPQAREHFLAWKDSGAGDENVFIQSLAADLAAQLNDFIVPNDVESLTAQVHVNELQHWLAVEAIRRCGNAKGKERERRLKELTGMSKKQIERWVERKFQEGKGG